MTTRFEVTVLQPMPLVVIERSTFACKAEAEAYVLEKKAKGYMTRTIATAEESQVYSLAIFRIRRDLETMWRQGTVL